MADPDFIDLCYQRILGGEAYPAGNFFSALPSGQERATYERDAACDSIAGIDLRVDAQTVLAQEFATYFSDCPLA